MTKIEKELNRRADIIIRQEKQIEIDARQIRALQKQNGELTDKVKELEAQIEKMKCCGNCAKNGHICVAEEMQGKLCGKNKDKWEIKEND
jgi:predicted RNase H-like nuclease (RuvC/YqgF family)